MSETSGTDDGRDALLADLSRVFANHRGISERYAVCDLTGLSRVVDGTFEKPVGVRRDDSGGIFTTLSDEFPNPIAQKLGDECFVMVPNFMTEPPSWDCIMYLTS